MTTRRKTLAQLAKQLQAAKTKKKQLKAKADEAAAEHDGLERELIERLEEEEMGSFRTADGTLFAPTRTTYSQVQNPAEFVAWAAEHRPELLETKHRKGLLHELVRTCLDDNEPLPPGVGFYVDEYVSQRAA